MLKKLLKYDLKALFRFWWIAVLVSMVMSVLGGFSLMIDNMNRPIPEALSMVAGLFRTLMLFSYTATFVLGGVLIFIRYYRNFFSDEGYLTFTLPVERHTLLNSKIISGMTLYAAALLVIFADIFIVVAIARYDYVFSARFPEAVKNFFVGGMSEYGCYFWIYILEFLTLILLGGMIALMLLYTCITFGSVIAQKGKAIAAIGIFYGVTNVLFFISILMLLLCAPNISYWMDDLSSKQSDGLVALILLCLILFEAMLCGLMYTLQYRMLKRKLNLS